ncbi:neutral/alkaline non-lysosomal ceramidase N-terminal domain-containing protein [Candidatus Villigracilis affinis]|uniref:neutral/alkaline non-lysosomal ceramidase N-terminal domain-containing protein n=1 Tax=Candidatus Villigracilis affinis TaxID=3140682 RepID=UPI002A1CCB5B|nr:neutral/alkaline non-lysosomal ceramidase N-terminal domain-containing protein [Anaerolineales bacterium]
MKIGYAQTVITPSLDKPVYLAGFGQNRRAETVHDDLYARALTIQTEEITLVLVALDLIGFFQQDMKDVVEALKVSDVNLHVVIASTHTHHGPDTMGLWGPDDKTCGVDSDYMFAIKKKIVDTINASLSDLKPASAKWTSVHVSGLAKNARNPEILDDELTLLQFAADDGKPLVTLFDFPCHPEVLWEHNPNITADYVGYLRDEVEKQTGAPCIFFSGALGGMMTPDVKDHSFEEAEFMGRKLGEEGVKALDAVNSEQYSVVGIQKKEIKAKLTNPLYKVAFLRKLIPDVRDRKGYLTTEVNLIKIGGLWLATVPGELLPKLGLQLKAWMKEAGAQVTGVIGLANDEVGYILPVEDFKYPLNPFKPGKHYEETNSIGKGIATSVMDALREVIASPERESGVTSSPKNGSSQ